MRALNYCFSWCI